MFKNYSLLILITFLFFTFRIVTAQQFERAETATHLGSISNNNGIAVADFDLDNDLDIFIVGTLKFDVNDPNTWSRLLKNNGDGTFDDVTITAGFAEGFNHTITLVVRLPDGTLNTIDPMLGDKLAASWADYNNDGYPDIFLANAVQSQLYKNNGDGTFTNVTAAAGFEVTCNACYITGAFWWDFNNDGFLDIYLTDYNYNSNNKLYKNNGDGTFTLFIDTHLNISSNSFDAISFDANGDEFLDLYVANDFDLNNFLFINQGGNSFIESAVQYGVQDPFDGMGLATCDFDNNGAFDLLITNIKENGFYVKNLSNTYDNKAIEVGISDTDWSWGAVFADFDLDGYEDFFVANGITGLQFDHYYKNTASGITRHFTETPVTQASGIEASVSRSTVSFDYDNDGDLDLIVSDYNSNLFFYRNTSITSLNTNNKTWSKIKLIGTASNKDALGSKIEITTNTGLKQYRLYNGSLYQSQSVQPIHFGLLDATTITSIKVTWPTGLSETITNLPINTTITMTENNGFTLGNDDFTVLETTIKIYPNPVNNVNEITVTNTFKDSPFLLFDLLGRKMPIQQNFIPESHQTKIKLGPLSSGIYILKTKNMSKKLIVN